VLFIIIFGTLSFPIRLRWSLPCLQVRGQNMDAGLRVTVTADVMTVESLDQATSSYVLHCVVPPTSVDRKTTSGLRSRTPTVAADDFLLVFCSDRRW